MNNEATLKAFKMACLAYKPSIVPYEQTAYTREQLMEAKDFLMSYCLGNLRHLDLGNPLSSFVEINPKHTPKLPSTAKALH
jgi:hypothetical protein